MTRRGCSVVPYLLLCLVVVGLAAPSEGPDRASSLVYGPSLRGAPQPAVTDGRTVGSGLVPGPVGAPTLPVGLSGSSVAPDASVPAPTGEVGTALYWATATWCAPTPTQCQGWGGNAKLGAVNGFRFGDEPYWVRVWRLDRHVDVLVVSFCQCGGLDAAIDLSPAAFRVLAPLDRGRVDVAIEDLRGIEYRPLPATDGSE